MSPPTITSGGISGQGKKIAHTFPYTSKSDPKKSYQCLVYIDGTISCGCPGWTRRVVNGVRECKHTQLTEQALRLLENSDSLPGLPTKAGKQGIVDPTANSKRKFNFGE